jgi:hypothetical protein
MGRKYLEISSNSIVTGIIFSALYTLRPVSVEPVNESLAIRFEVAKACPASAPKPVTIPLLQVKYHLSIPSTDYINLLVFCSLVLQLQYNLLKPSDFPS